MIKSILNQSDMEAIINDYITQLQKAGAASAKILKRVNVTSKIETLNTLKNVQIPNALEVLLSYEYDQDLCDELDYYEPEFAWGMYLLNIREIQSVYTEMAGKFRDDDSYFPEGFIPILTDGNSNYVAVNCIPNSPTFGAVYDITDGVGANLLANTLEHFFISLHMELEQGLRTFDDPEISECTPITEWFSTMSTVFGNTPYFSRKGKMDTQIIDWK